MLRYSVDIISISFDPIGFKDMICWANKTITCKLIKVHLYEIFNLFFFSSINSIWERFLTKSIFEYKFEFAEIFEFESNSVYYPNMLQDFYFLLEQYNKLFLFRFRFHFSSHSIFRISFQIFKFWGTIAEYAE